MLKETLLKPKRNSSLTPADVPELIVSLWLPWAGGFTGGSRQSRHAGAKLSEQSENKFLRIIRVRLGFPPLTQGWWMKAAAAAGLPAPRATRRRFSFCSCRINTEHKRLRVLQWPKSASPQDLSHGLQAQQWWIAPLSQPNKWVLPANRREGNDSDISTWMEKGRLIRNKLCGNRQFSCLYRPSFLFINHICEEKLEVLREAATFIFCNMSKLLNL